MVARNRPSMVDVARLAGTSKATVSNVIHGHRHVRVATRARVLDAIETLGYHVNIPSRTLGIVLGNLENPWYATVAAHMEETARNRGYAVLIVSTGRQSLRDPRAHVEASRIRELVEHGVAAIVFLAYSGSPDVVREVPRDTPAVFVGSQGVGGPTVAVDDRLGAHIAVTHLLELGHRRIGYVSTNSDADPLTDDDRYASYTQTLAAAGMLAESDGLVVRLEGSIRPQDHPSHARDAIDRLLTDAQGPTAIFAASDLAAIEILDRADALGRAVPGDLSIVGYDDISMASVQRISLTTVGQPTDELVEQGITAAIALATGDGARVRTRTLLRPKLIVRATTGPPPPPQEPRALTSQSGVAGSTPAA